MAHLHAVPDAPGLVEELAADLHSNMWFETFQELIVCYGSLYDTSGARLSLQESDGGGEIILDL